MLGLLLAAPVAESGVDPRMLFSCFFWSREDFAANKLEDANQVLTLNIAVQKPIEKVSADGIEVLNSPNVFGRLSVNSVEVSGPGKPLEFASFLVDEKSRSVRFSTWRVPDTEHWASTIFVVPTRLDQPREQYSGFCMLAGGFNKSMLQGLREQK